jgi:pimeloyl-ACP methyl ester carboxylesterase
MLRSMPEAREITVIGDGRVALSARVFDGPAPDAPGLLLHHGLASSQHIWDQMLPWLTRRLRVVTFDARGHGLSGKPNRRYGFDHVVADALAVSRGANLRRPVVAGHSWGAMVTLELAARHPRSIAGAVLVDGGLQRMRDELDWPSAKELLAPPHLTGMPLEQFRGLMRTFMADAVDLTPDVEAQVLSVMHVRSDGTIAPRLARSNHFRILRAIWEQDTPRLWARVRVPALAVVAHGTDPDRDDRVRRAVAEVRALTRGHPVTIGWMRGIHDLPLQHPEALSRRIERFARTAVR